MLTLTVFSARVPVKFCLCSGLWDLALCIRIPHADAQDRSSSLSDQLAAERARRPPCTQVVMPDAPHPCYLKDPHAFNAFLLQFAGAAGAAGVAGSSTLRVHADW